MITCPSCKTSFSENQQPCKKCGGSKFIKQPIFKKYTAAMHAKLHSPILAPTVIGDKIQVGEKDVICPRCNGNGTEVSAANRNNRKRGAANEYKAVDIFKEWWKGPNGETYEWRKTPQSGGSVLAEGFDMAGDICTTAPDFKYHVECKRTEGWDLGQLLHRAHEGIPAYGDLAKYIEQILVDVPRFKHDLPVIGSDWIKVPLLWMMHPGPSQPTYVLILQPHVNGSIFNHTHHGIFTGYMLVDGTKISGGGIYYTYYIMNLKTFLKFGTNFWRNNVRTILYGH